MVVKHVTIYSCEQSDAVLNRILEYLDQKSEKIIVKLIRAAKISMQKELSRYYGVSDYIVFIAPVATAVGTVSKLIRGDISDPEIVVCDVSGKFFVPLYHSIEGVQDIFWEDFAKTCDMTMVDTGRLDVSKYSVDKKLHVGIGCRKGTAFLAILEFVNKVFDELGEDIRSVSNVATIDIKQDEAGIVACARNLGANLICFTSEELNRVQGDFSDSEFVMNTVGVGNVCERAACLSSKYGNRLCVKQSQSGITISVYEDR